MSSIISRIRNRIRFLFFAGIILAALTYWPFTSCNFLKIGYVRFICPLGFLETTIATRTVSWPLAIGFIFILGLIFLLGRFYCSWLCPASYFGNRLSVGSRRVFPQRLVRSVDEKWQRLSSGISSRVVLGRGDALALFIGIGLGVAVFGYPAFCLVCPLGVLSRGLIDLLVHFQLRWESLFLLFPLVVGLFFSYGWRCACPVGIVHGVAAIRNRTWVSVKDKDLCEQCDLCSKACRSGLYPHKDEPLQPFDCTKCFDCVEACPRGARSAAWKKTSG